MPKHLEFTRNQDQFRKLLEQLQNKAKIVRVGGGQKKIDEQRKRGKLTARERIEYLVDKNSFFLELGLFAGDGMYKEYGGCPSGGVITGIGHVAGRQCVIVANDATVKAGAWFPISGKKNLRAQEVAMDNRLPIVYLVDSPEFFFPCRMKFFRIRNISADSLETTRKCRQWVLSRLQL